VDSNPVGARRHLNGTNHPASKEDPASAAGSDGNPNEPDEKPRGLPARRYAGPRRRAGGAEEAVRGCDGRVAVVVVTRNRLPELLTTLGHLRSLPERPQVVVVDNASTDGTARTVRKRFPDRLGCSRKLGS
jgi:hypothetical protein